MRNRSFCRVVLASVLALLFSTVANAQAFPSRTITVLTPIPPGNSYQIALRQMADTIQQRTGATIIMEPAVGANGIIPLQKLARAEADGYTLAICWAAPLTLNPHISPDIGYDPLRDFAPVMMITRHGIPFFALASSPVNNVRDLVALAKAKPGQVKIGYGGTGSRVGIIQLAEAAGVQFLEVPYKSPAQQSPALLSGEVDILVHALSEQIGLIQAGKVKSIFIGSKNRSPMIPNVASITEVYPNVEIGSWFAVMAPAKTPADRISWHNREWNAALKDPKIIDRMQNTFGYEVIGGAPRVVTDQVAAESPVYARIVKANNIKE
jgi:tripartite-type tricarboxylate transporter receptor subunit TctC